MITNLISPLSVTIIAFLKPKRAMRFGNSLRSLGPKYVNSLRINLFTIVNFYVRNNFNKQIKDFLLKIKILLH